jgi:hypothetical protein
MGRPEPIFGYHRYDIDNVRRKRRTVPRAPRGTRNHSVQPLYDRRLANRPLNDVPLALSG